MVVVVDRRRDGGACMHECVVWLGPNVQRSSSANADAGDLMLNARSALFTTTSEQHTRAACMPAATGVAETAAGGRYYTCMVVIPRWTK